MLIGLDARDVLRREHGITVLTSFLLKGLAEINRGDEFIQYVDDYHNNTPSDQGVIRAPGFRVRELKGRDVVWKQIRLPAALKADRADVFHSLTSTIPLRRPCPTVVTVCDLFHEVHPELIPPRALRRIRLTFAYAARHADRLIAISENTKRDLIRFYGTPEDKISVIYPGVNPFYQVLESEHDGGPIEETISRYGLNSPYLLHVGGLTENRNISGLLDALLLLKKQEIRAKLVLVGRAFWGFDLKAELERRLLCDDVNGITYVSNSDLRVLYNRAAAVLLPSFYEGFGIPILEAMACGTPVITSNLSAMPEAAGDAGLLVDPRDAGAIATAIRHVLEDAALREKMVAKGLKRARLFSWPANAARTIEVYHSLATDS